MYNKENNREPKKDPNKCESCGTKEWERWSNGFGLHGRRCINKCLSSYTINQEQMYKQHYD